MKPFLDAVLTTTRAVWTVTPTRVHQVGSVPPGPATPYLVLSVSSGSAENYRMSADHGSRSYRIVAQAVGADADEVSFAVTKLDLALLDKRLTVAGFDCSPCQPEVSSPVIRDPDGGGFLTCTLTYTFTAYPTE